MRTGWRIFCAIAALILLVVMVGGWAYVAGLACAFANYSDADCRVNYLDPEFLSFAWPAGLAALAFAVLALWKPRR